MFRVITRTLKDRYANFFARRRARRLLVLSRHCALEGMLWIRLLDPECGVPEINQDKDDIVRLSWLRCVAAVPLALDESNQKIYDTHKLVIDSLVERALSQHRFKETTSVYLSAHAIIGEIKGSSRSLIDLWWLTARAVSGNPGNADLKNVRTLLRESRRNIRRLQSTIGDRHALKFDLTSADLLHSFAILPVVLLTTSYLYDHLLFSHFGLSAEQFFTTGDYLSSSLGRITPAIYLAIVGAIAFLLGRHFASRRPQSLTSQTRQDDLAFVFVGAINGVSASVSAWKGSNNSVSLPVAVCVVLLLIVDKHIIWLFARPHVARFVLMTAIIYSGVLAHEWIDQVDAIERPSADRSKMSFVGIADVNTAKLVLMHTTENYIFFWDPSTETTTVVKRDEIKTMRIGR
ncbi:MAG: hypothetical protein JWR16_538 [Nevskia sp.]|nr:hypothetical protein [Nevskia sp.]